MATGPMVTESSAGSPTTTSPRAATSASWTRSASSAGTRIRRTAVHFCPVFWVISRATSRMKRSKVAPVPAPGARTAAFSESASTL